jgi:hypothetical protein
LPFAVSLCKSHTLMLGVRVCVCLSVCTCVCVRVYVCIQAPESYKDVTEVVNTCHAAGISQKAIKLRPVAVVKG